MKARHAALLGAVASVSFGACAAQPVYPPFGLDLIAPDKTTRPGDDFYQYSNGNYLAHLQIAPDEVSAGKRFDITRRNLDNLHAIMEDAAKGVGEQPGDLKGKVGAMYAAFMDEPAIEAGGAKPITPELNAIRAAPDRSALEALMATPGLYPSPFGAFIDIDQKNTDRYAIYLGAGGFLLPSRDYYLEPQFAPQRAAMRAYVVKLLTLAGWPDPAANADAIMAFETKLAEVSWTQVQMRDPTTQYNPMSPAELAAYAPGFDWQAYLKGAGLQGKQALIVTTNTAFPTTADVTATTPLDTLKAWMAFRVVDLAAPYLAKSFADASFDLHGRTLSGQVAQKPRWKRAITAVGGDDCAMAPQSCFGTLSWGVGQLFSERYFPAATKAEVEALVANLKTAFRHRIEALTWMGPATKAEALRKLDTYTVKVGYPDHPRDYSRVVIRRDDLLGDVRAAAAADWAFQLGRSDGPVDRTDWLMTPQTNDAYNGSLRDIVFPAGILQAPIFDPAADPAINYGAVGAVIGHEMTHGFDDQGRHIDATGALRDWWTPADAAAFTARAKVLGDQYAQFEPIPGMHINPGLTMGENLADLGGLSIALDAYHESLHGRPAPVLAGLTGDQRVFLGWAQAWAGKLTPEAIRKQTASDPHSYRKYRVNGVVRDIDGWYAAFGIKPGDAMYIPPEQRARIW